MHPHCDQRILHAPGECDYCDEHPDWQRLRDAWGIAFTGQLPGLVSATAEPGGMTVRTFRTAVDPRRDRARLPCPADFNRPPTGDGPDHRRWAGNVATTQEPVNETPASQMLYSQPTVNVQAALRDILDEARSRPGFMRRLRANVAKHRDLLNRLKDG